MKVRPIVITFAAIAAIASLLVPFVVPRVLSEYWLHVIIFAYYYAVLASCWNLEAGFTGQFSFAYLGYSAIGAYASALTVINWGIPPFLGMVFGGVLSLIVGFLLGVLCLRMRAVYLALTTIAFSEVLRIFLMAEYEITRGALGLDVPPFFEGAPKLQCYYTMLGLLILCLFILYKLVNSRFGLFIRAIREDEDAAACMAVDVVRYRVLVSAVGAFFSGLAGAFYAHYVLLIAPTMMVFSEMAKVISMGVIGGMESLMGPLLGAFFVQILDEYLRVIGMWRLVVFGLILLLTIRFRPRGFAAPLLQRLLGMLEKLKPLATRSR